jgi:hypothetical protein
MANWPLLGMFIHVGAGGGMGVIVSTLLELASVGVFGSDRCLVNVPGRCSYAVLDVCRRCFGLGIEPFSAAASDQSSSSLTAPAAAW